MSTLVFIAQSVLIGIVVFSLARIFFSKRPAAPLPPGPKPYFLIGNLFDLPSQKQWIEYAEWGRKYGPIASATIFGQTIIIVNSWQAAVDMLDKKGAIYSDRPVAPMTGELIGWRESLVFFRYGPRFRRARKLFHQAFGPRNVQQYMPLEERETHRFLRHVLESPKDLREHIRHTAGAIILLVSHGYEVKGTNDDLILLADDVMDKFSITLAPGAFWVDMMPILQYVPDWFPGASFKRKAKRWHASLNEMADRPFEYVKKQIAAGTALPSFASELLDSGKELSEEELQDIKWSAFTVYGAGADTTVSAIYAFFLAMTLYPDIQKKAQAELDAVVGTDRLPKFADRDHLPYVTAVTLEIMRWNVVAPLSVVHRLTEDDVHDGYFIPEGSLILTNVHSMLKNPETYPNPDTFDPTRFIPSEGKETQKDPRDMAFGFGRRVCPGMHLVDDAVFISVAMSLAVFDITKEVDENGVVIEPVVDRTNGNVSHPVPFKCSIRPRSTKAEALIMGSD